jgi:predicted dehydrogenase
MAERKARIGFIGAGWWATSNHMPIMAARKDVEMVAVCRLGKKELDRVKEAFDFEYATEDYGRLLDEVELDGVVVASPHTLHYEHARAALERGLHVMVEKPMCTRASEARELVRLAREKNLHLLVPYGWHYKAFVQEARRQLESGAVGRIEHVLSHMASPIRELLSGGQFRMGEMFFEPDSATWADPKVAGGGYGHAQLSHSTGMMFWLTGLEPSQVYAVMSAPGSRVELYDAMTVRFKGGAIGVVSGAGDVPKDKGFQVDLRVFGSEGALILDCDRARLEVQRHDGRHYAMELPPDAGAYTCEGPPNNFADLVLGATDANMAPGWAAARSVELLDAAYRSARSGKPEDV